MDNLKQEMLEARNERETGDANKALQMYLQIDRSDLKDTQLFNYLGELGLTYWHLKMYDEAKNTFEELKNLADEVGNNSYLALSLRHLSRPEFNEKNPKAAVEYAKRQDN